jgi:Tol biopolymer transport system component
LIGKTLNHYRVIEKLGSGGMSEVYLAEDTRLNRRVALKILPSDVASDAARRGRFEREAQAVAALNHPNIVTIYSVEDAEGLHYITMELIQGRTLAQMIPAKGLPLAKFFDLAVPIADAVSAAHKRGITHRDLKPDNIMLSDDGRIKILDFGLVKLTETAGEPVATNLPTNTLTSEGKILGTVAYMSPEQAEGKPVDQRSDIFSLGVVFYRMVTGRQPFQGDTRMSVLSSILRDTPASVTDLNPALPRHLGRIIKRCLAKNPDERYSTAQDLKNELAELRKEEQSGAGGPAAAAGTPVQPSSKILLTFALVGAGLLAGAAVIYFLMRPAGRAGESASAVVHGSFAQLTDEPGEELFPSLSPDGRMVAYSSRASGNWDVYVQSVSGRNAVNLTKDSTADDTQPAFSPDGQKIAFRSGRDGGGIFVMGVLGDSVVRITGEGYRPAWSPDGAEIAYEIERWANPAGRNTINPLWAINVETRQKRKITAGDAVQPAWSPHGWRIAYWGILGRTGQRDLWTIPAQGGNPVRVTEDSALDWNPVWSPDGRFLYFISDRDGNMNVWRVPIDEASGEVRGSFQPVTQGATGAARDLCLSADGKRLVYSSASNRQNILRYPIEPGSETVLGEPSWVTRGSEAVVNPDPSPDGEWVAYQTVVNQEDIFIVHPDGTGRRQLTHDAARDRTPRWSPDGKKIAFYSNRSGSYEIWTINPDSSDLSQLTASKISFVFPIWSPDGSRIYVSDPRGDGGGLISPNLSWREQKIERLPPHGMGDGSFVAWSWSPDGTKLAGIIFRGGKYNTGIVVYDYTTRKYTRVTDRGTLPTWLNDNRRLLTTDTASKVYLVDSQTNSIKPILSVAPDNVDIFSMRVSRDNHLYIVRIDRQSDLWMLTLQ